MLLRGALGLPIGWKTSFKADDISVTIIVALLRRPGVGRSPASVLEALVAGSGYDVSGLIGRVWIRGLSSWASTTLAHYGQGGAV